jgi:serine-type D-Ala-D-Ala carboxypeptidase
MCLASGSDAVSFIPTDLNINIADLSELTRILQAGIDNSTYPGAVGVIGGPEGIYWAGAVGHHTYDANSPLVSVKDTYFDMASCSKVLGTTSVIALLYQGGYIALDDKVSQYLGEDYGDNGGKADVTLRNCLLHNAGYLPDPDPLYYNTSFSGTGCPNSLDHFPHEDDSCLDLIYSSLKKEALVTPAGDAFKYSDLSFITLQWVAGVVIESNGLVLPPDLRGSCSTAEPLSASSLACHFEAFARTKVFDSAAMEHTGLTYLLDEQLWPAAMPTIDDNIYINRRPQGQVSDGNCYAMGGVCGHAGLFGTGPSVASLMQAIVAEASPTSSSSSSSSDSDSDSARGSNVFLNTTTIATFTTLNDPSQSSRALGWDTNYQDPTGSVADNGFTNSCGSFPAQTFMHIGYTGTCVCGTAAGNRGKGLYSVVLTNRVYNCEGQKCPSELATYTENVYRNFNSKAWAIFGER